ncbi:type II secretion system protein [bacterium]|nr:MAG: type II secretion system protein [bacterium]
MKKGFTPYYNLKNKVLKFFKLFLAHKREVVVRGFTLIELLIVIAILAVLSTAVVLVLNPAELLKQGRDSTRISDLAAVNGAISLWVADVLNSSGNWPAAAKELCTASTTQPSGFNNGTACVVNTNTTSTGVNSWVPLDFSLIAAGSPLSRLPMDPNNTSTNCSLGTPAVCQYALYASTTVGSYKIITQMESVKFRTSGSADVTSKDGGTSNNWYEVGSMMSL